MLLYMAEINKYNLNDIAVTCIIVNDSPWFKAKEVATILGYANTKQAIIKQSRRRRQTDNRTIT